MLISYKETFNPGTWVIDRETISTKAVKIIVTLKDELKKNADTLNEYQINYNGQARGYYAYAAANETLYTDADSFKLNALERTAAAAAAYEENKNDETEAAYKNALEVEKWLASEINYYNESITIVTNRMRCTQKYLDFCTNFESHISELVALYQERSELISKQVAEQAELFEKSWLLDCEINDINTELNAIAAAFNGTESVIDGVSYGVQGITSINSQIENLEDQIKNLEKQNKDISAIANIEMAIEISKQIIEANQIALAYYETQLEVLKGVLDMISSEE